MKRILFICILVLTYRFSDAQNLLSGKVTDSNTGEAIPGATVYVPELKTGTITDLNGSFKIENLPRTRLIVQVSFLGYKSIIEDIDLADTTVMDFKMEEAITEMNEVVITASSRATEISRTPVPMITVSSRELQQNLNTNIVDALSKLPGISAVTTGPNVSKPFIHGLGFNRVLTLYDGVRQEGQQWGDEHGIEIDENSVDRIEIVKGPASLTYGSDALAGVVNMLPAQPVPDGTFKGHAETNYQTNNGLIAAHTALAGNSNGFNWGAVVSHKQATNYRNKTDGRVYGTGFNETDISGHFGLNKKWGYSDLNFSLFDVLQEIPDGSRDSVTRRFTKQITEIDAFRPIVQAAELKSYRISDIHQHVQHYRVYSSNNFIIGTGKLAVVLGYQKSSRREFSHPEYPDIPGLYLDLNSLTYDLKFSIPFSKGWDATVGLNGMYQKNINKGTEFIIPDYKQFDMGPFGLLKKTIGNLDISIGLRYDTRIFRNDEMFTHISPSTGFEVKVIPPDTALAENPFSAFKRTFTGISGSTGMTYKISDGLTLKANIGRGFRTPNIAEISANGVHPGTLIYQIGNIDFKPEFSLQEDLGVSFLSDHISGSLDVFNNSISNYIFNQKLLNRNGNDSIIVQGNQTFKFQQSTARLYGWDVTLDIHPYDWLHFENSISAVYALNKGGKGIQLNDSSKYLPFIPPLHTISELRLNIKKISKHFRSLYLKTGMEYFARQSRIYSADNTETPTEGYALFNAGAGLDITDARGKILISVNILGSNITNVVYQSHMSRLKYFEPYPDNGTGRNGIYGMGRNVSFKFTIPFESKINNKL